MIFQQFNLVGRARRADQRADGPRSPRAAARARCSKLWTDAREGHGALARSSGSTWRACAGQRADTLSGGQQQRVAIARALVQEPEIILADEPIASLDPRNTQVVMDALLHINRHFGITVLCNLHCLDLARNYCDRLVGMAAGKRGVRRRAGGPHRARGARPLRPGSGRRAGPRGPLRAVRRRSPASHSPGPDRYRPLQQGDLHVHPSTDPRLGARRRRARRSPVRPTRRTGRPSIPSWCWPSCRPRTPPA